MGTMRVYDYIRLMRLSNRYIYTPKLARVNRTPSHWVPHWFCSAWGSGSDHVTEDTKRLQVKRGRVDGKT